jgi:hypothetical protein
MAYKQRKYGRAQRMWVFDRGVVSEENLEGLRRRGARYLVGTPRAQLKAHERRLLEGSWQELSAEVQVQLIAQDKEDTYVLARSRSRAQKETAMRSRFVRGLMRELIRLRHALRHGRLKDPDKVLLQLGRLKERYRKAWRYVKISFDRLRLSWQWDRHALRLAAARAGAYLLRPTWRNDRACLRNRNTFESPLPNFLRDDLLEPRAIDNNKAPLPPANDFAKGEFD